MKALSYTLMLGLGVMSLFSYSRFDPIQIQIEDVQGTWQVEQSPDGEIWIFEANGSFKKRKEDGKTRNRGNVQLMMNTLLFPDKGTWTIREDHMIEIIDSDKSSAVISLTVETITPQELKGYWGNQTTVILNRIEPNG